MLLWGAPSLKFPPIPPHNWHFVPGHCPGIPAIVGSWTHVKHMSFTHPHQPQPWARHWDVPVLVDPRGPCPGLGALPDTSREEMLAALQLAKRVKGLAKTISATFWDPVQEVAARRREIRGLRMELLAGAGLPEQKMAVAQLRRALRELQVGECPWPPDGTRMAPIPLRLYEVRAPSWCQDPCLALRAGAGHCLLGGGGDSGGGMCLWSFAMPGGLQHPSKDPQPLFPGAEEPRLGEETGSGRGAQDKSDASAQCQGGHRSGCGPPNQGQPRCRRSPESWLHPHNISSCSHRTGSPQEIQHWASSLGPKRL